MTSPSHPSSSAFSRRRSPAGKVGVMVFVVLALALAFAAWILAAALGYGLAVKPLPFVDADRLVFVWEKDPFEPIRTTSSAAFVDWDRDPSFEMLAALVPTSFTFVAGEVQGSFFSRRVSADYFSLFGAAPLLGRLFTEEEASQGARVAVLSAGLWRRRLGGDPRIVGRQVTLDGDPYTVLGVVDFKSPREPVPVELWVPLAIDPEKVDADRRWLYVWGRLAPGVDRRAAQAELAARLRARRGREPGAAGGRTVEVRPIRDDYLVDFGAQLATLLAAAALTLVVVVGYGPFLLARVAGTGAIGARALALAAGLAIGVGAGLAAIPVFRDSVPVRFGLPQLDAVTIDAALLLVVFASALAVAVGWLLASRAARIRGVGARRALCAAAAAATLALAAAAGLALATYRTHVAAAGARAADHVLTLRTSLRGPAYREAAVRVEQIERRRAALAALPGVVAVGATDLIPLAERLRGTSFELVEEEDEAPRQVLLQVVTPGFVETTGVTVTGRAFTAADTAASAPVAMVNATFAARYLPAGAALGRRVAIAGDEAPSREIVGVAGDVRTYDKIIEPTPTLYVPHAQRPLAVMTFYVRTEGDPEALAAAAEEVLAGLDSTLPIYGVESLERIRREVDWPQGFTAGFLGLLAALVLAQAAVAGFSWMAGRREGMMAATIKEGDDVDVRP